MQTFFVVFIKGFSKNGFSFQFLDVVGLTGIYNILFLLLSFGKKFKFLNFTFLIKVFSIYGLRLLIVDMLRQRWLAWVCHGPQLVVSPNYVFYFFFLLHIHQACQNFVFARSSHSNFHFLAWALVAWCLSILIVVNFTLALQFTL